jgi:hypothetical protein
MKRTKLWWLMLTAEERRELINIEAPGFYDYGDETMNEEERLPFENHRAELIAKADEGVIMEQTMISQLFEESQNENQSV